MSLTFSRAVGSEMCEIGKGEIATERDRDRERERVWVLFFHSQMIDWRLLLSRRRREALQKAM